MAYRKIRTYAKSGGGFFAVWDSLKNADVRFSWNSYPKYCFIEIILKAKTNSESAVNPSKKIFKIPVNQDQVEYLLREIGAKHIVETLDRYKMRKKAGN